MDDTVISFHWNVAVSDYFATDLEKALETFQKISNQSPLLSFNKGIIYQRKGDHDLAIMEFQKASQHFDVQMFSYFGMAISCIMNDCFEEALVELLKLKQMIGSKKRIHFPSKECPWVISKADVLFNMAICHHLMSDNKNAQGFLEKARLNLAQSQHQEKIQNVLMYGFDVAEMIRIPQDFIIYYEDGKLLNLGPAKALKSTPLMALSVPAKNNAVEEIHRDRMRRPSFVPSPSSYAHRVSVYPDAILEDYIQEPITTTTTTPELDSVLPSANSTVTSRQSSFEGTNDLFRMRERSTSLPKPPPIPESTRAVSQFMTDYYDLDMQEYFEEEPKVSAMSMYFDSIMKELPDEPKRFERKSSSQAYKDMDNITTSSLYTVSLYEGEIVINIYGVWKSCYGFLQEKNFYIFESKEKQKIVMSIALNEDVSVVNQDKIAYEDYILFRVMAPSIHEFYTIGVKDRIEALSWISNIIKVTKGIGTKARKLIPVTKTEEGREPLLQRPELINNRIVPVNQPNSAFGSLRKFII